MAETFDARLAASESGSDYGAHRRNKDGREYTGKYQFGRERLKDFGLGERFTWNDFKKNKNGLQETIYKEHMADIDNYIDANGLFKYIGKTVGGVPVTRDAMRAMAHIGGSKGMHDFLITDGAYNPADELGTSIQAYGKKFSGGGTIRGNERGVNSLRQFADEASNASQNIVGQVLGFDTGTPLSLDDDLEITPHEKAMWGGGGYPNTPPPSVEMPGLSRNPFDGPTYPNTPPPDVMNPHVLPTSPDQVSQDSSDGGGSGGGGGQFAGSTVTLGEPYQKPGLFGQIGQALFPQAEDPAQQFRDTLSAFGVGLGQMSHGAPVDLAPFWNNVQAQRQAVIDNAMEQDWRAEQLGIQHRNTTVAERKVALDEAAAAVTGSGFSQEFLTDVSNNPRAAHLVEGLTSSDKTVRDDAYKSYNDIKAEEVKAQFGTNGDKAANLYRAMAAQRDGSGSEEDVIEAMRGMPATDIAKVMEGEQFKRPSAVVMADEITRAMKQGNFDYADTLREVSRTQAGISDAQWNQELVDYGMDELKRYGQAANAAASIMPTIRSIRGATDSIAKKKDERSAKETSFLTTMFSRYQGVARAANLNSVEELIANYVTGASLEDIELLDQGTKVLLAELARGAFEGQGSVSDQERRSLAESLVRVDTTGQQRIVALAQIEAMNAIDEIVFSQYSNTHGEKFANSVEASKEVQMLANRLKAPLIQSTVQHDLITRAGDFDTAESEETRALIRKAQADDRAGMDIHSSEAMYELYSRRAPVLSAEDAAVAAPFLLQRSIHYYQDRQGNLIRLPGAPTDG